MTGRSKRKNSSAFSLRALMWVITMSAAMLAVACGGDTTPTNNSSQYPTGIGGDIEKQLKYDARVQDFNPNGNTLIINVNDSWVSSPPGMRARALGQWYTLWQQSHGAGSKIIVKHDGNDVDTWTAEKGYQPVEKKESDEG